MSAQKDGHLSPFASTQWSLVDRAAQACSDRQRESLGVLLQRYLPALRTHLRVEKRISPERVEDLLQEFVADKVVEQNLIAQADRHKGKFRSFLLLALNGYVIDQLRHDGAAKRSGGIAAEGVEDQPDLSSGEPEPSRQLDVVWARELIAEALRRMKCECEKSGRAEIWAVFECRVVKPAFEAAEPMPYELLIERFGLRTPMQASNLLTTAKRMFARSLRSVAREYVGDEELVDQEIDDLRSILSEAYCGRGSICCRAGRRRD